jgi:hypothetical protein
MQLQEQVMLLFKVSIIQLDVPGFLAGRDASGSAKMESLVA